VHAFERNGFKKTLKVVLAASRESPEQDCAVLAQLLINDMHVGLSPRFEIHATEGRHYDKRQVFTRTQVLELHEFVFRQRNRSSGDGAKGPEVMSLSFTVHISASMQLSCACS
jgi:hypothetical protein